MRGLPGVGSALLQKSFHCFRAIRDARCHHTYDLTCWESAVRLHFVVDGKSLPYTLTRKMTPEEAGLKDGDILCLHWRLSNMTASVAYEDCSTQGDDKLFSEDGL